MISPEKKTAWENFLTWSRRSGWSQEALAEEAGTSRAHLNQVLQGHRTGGHTWRRVVKVLPLDGLLLLQQCAAWNTHAQAALDRRLAAESAAATLARIAAACRTDGGVEGDPRENLGKASDAPKVRSGAVVSAPKGEEAGTSTGDPSRRQAAITTTASRAILSGVPA
jgi:hypothetical protein